MRASGAPDWQARVLSGTGVRRRVRWTCVKLDHDNSGESSLREVWTLQKRFQCRTDYTGRERNPRSAFVQYGLRSRLFTHHG